MKLLNNIKNLMIKTSHNKLKMNNFKIIKKKFKVRFKNIKNKFKIRNKS